MIFNTITLILSITLLLTNNYLIGLFKDELEEVKREEKKKEKKDSKKGNLFFYIREVLFK